MTQRIPDGFVTPADSGLSAAERSGKAMKDRMIFRCNACEDYVIESKDGDSYLDCCGRSRVKLAVNSTDASLEKHLPVLEQVDGKLVVHVGKTAHPMSAEHFIDWIGLEIDGVLHSTILKPGEAARAVFEPASFLQEDTSGKMTRPHKESATASWSLKNRKVTVYAHCNLHGLWKTDG
ncbi:MAG: desulfoferrodoxin family protein [Ethanoligenens sp.]